MHLMLKTQYIASDNFTYKHKNPYHLKLKEFEGFTYRDHEPELLRGLWNQQAFGNDNPLYLEIGCGFGQFLRQFSEENRHINLVGIEYKFKRCFELAQKLNRHQLENCKLLRSKAERVHHVFAESELDKILIFFPDPWKKKKQLKRRFIQREFLANIYPLLKKNGEIYIKTDDLDYYQLVLEELAALNSMYEIVYNNDNLLCDEAAEFPILSRYQTHFEKIFRGQKIPIKALVLRPNKH